MNMDFLERNVRHCHERSWSFTQLTGKIPPLTAWQLQPHATLSEVLAWAGRRGYLLKNMRLFSRVPYRLSDLQDFVLALQKQQDSGEILTARRGRGTHA